MVYFRNLVVVSLLAGIVAGLLLTVLQHYQTQPLILAAEQFETQDSHHSHEWHPEEGTERLAFTTLFNMLTGFGFALLLCTAMFWQGVNGYTRGLLWGVAGYLVFFVAPSLGLPPELPGTESAALHSRQAWWLFTAFATATGLFAVVFSKNLWLKLTGVILLGLPHFLGAPHPETFQALAPEALQQRFVWLSALGNGLFWLLLGALSGWLLPKVKL